MKSVFKKFSAFCSHPVITFLALILAGCCLGLLSLYFSAGEYSLFLLKFYLSQPLVMVLNLLPFVLFALLLYGLTNRAWLAFLLDGIVCLFFSWAQYWKLTARNDPIFAEDLTLISEAAQMSGQYIQISWQIILSAVLVLIAALVLALLFRGKLKHFSLRLVLPALVIAASCLLYTNIYTSAKVYYSMHVWPEINQWFETNKYISRGGIYPFIYSIQSAVINPPEDYSVEKAQELLTSYETDSIPEEEKVSVIVVMYEAFSDLTRYCDAITGVDPYEAFHNLQEESYHGTLITNIFAGGTIDSERCVLTGFSQLTNFRRPSWSYARYFADQGYTVNGGHAGYEAFYNRLNVNENLGIPGYRFIENYYNNLFPGVIPTDAQLLPEITDYCKTQMEEGPVFSFNVTYQNHGPYGTNYSTFSEPYVPQGNLSESDYNIINNYLSGVANTGEQMMAMADSFRDSEEPVILLFFGDHKPWLGEQSVTYQALGIDIFSETDESFYTYYATEYTIWANEAASAALGEDFTGVGPTVSPCFLMNVLFDKCGWGGSSYTKLTNEVMSAMPILHTTGRYQIDGVMVDEADLPETQSQLLSNMRIAQFYLAQDADATLP